MSRKISDKELRGKIYEMVQKTLDSFEESSVPNGRDLSIVIKSLKTRLHYVNYKDVPSDSPIASTDFKKLIVNSDRYLELFDKIKGLISSKVSNFDGKSFALRTNEFQLSDDDKQVFLAFSEEIVDDQSDKFSDSFGDDLDGVSQEISEKINRFGMHVTIQLIQGTLLLVTLDTPFNFAAYNNELDKYLI